MAQYRGNALYLAFKGTAINADFREFTASEAIDLIDSSAGADVAKTYITGLEDGTASLTALDDTGGTALTYLYNLCDKGAEGTLEWAPEGTAVGKPRHYVNAIVSSRERAMPYDDNVTLSIEFQFSGVVTNTTY